MNWVNVKEVLPPNSDDYGKDYLVTVVCSSWSKAKTMSMSWECVKVRNKEVKRWKWNYRIKPEEWIVTHWMEYPKPANI